MLALSAALMWRPGAVLSQPGERPAAVVARAQSSSIAGEVVRDLRLALQSGCTGLQRAEDSERWRTNTRPDHPIGVVVESAAIRTLVENALLEALQQSGFKPFLPLRPVPNREMLSVLVLDQSVEYMDLPEGGYRRTVRTQLEARYSAGGSVQICYLGSYHREGVDTVSHREDGGLWLLAGDGKEEEPGSLLDRVISPVLLITGAFLVIYLFFTIRN